MSVTSAPPLTQAELLGQVLSGLNTLPETRSANQFDTNTELALAQQLTTATLSIARHRAEGVHIDPRNILIGLGCTSSLIITFSFFLNILEYTK